MSMSSDGADDEATATAATTDADEVPDWLAALQPAAPVAVAEPPPTRPAAASVKAQEPMPALLAEDDLPAWLMKLGEETPPPPPAPVAPQAGAVSAWMAGSGEGAEIAHEPVAAEPASPVWGRRESKSAPTEAAGAAIFASLAAAPVAIEATEPDTASASSSQQTVVPWWWLAAGAAAVLLLVLVIALLVLRSAPRPRLAAPLPAAP